MWLNSKVECEYQGHIFSALQLVSYSFACHISFKVKHFGKVVKA